MQKLNKRSPLGDNLKLTISISNELETIKGKTKKRALLKWNRQWSRKDTCILKELMTGHCRLENHMKKQVFNKIKIITTYSVVCLPNLITVQKTPRI